MPISLPRSASARLYIALAAVAALVAIAQTGSSRIAVGVPAVADAAPACPMTLDRARSIAADANADGATTAEYAGGDAAKIVEAVNAVPPVSDYAAEIVLTMANGDHVKVALVHAGCVEHALTPPREAWEALVKQALGDRS